MEKKRVVLLGATGMVGGAALRYCLDHVGISAVTVIGRRSCGLRHDKLTEVLHPDLADCSTLIGFLKDQDVALYCVGAYTGSISDEEFRKITVDYTLAFARVLHEASPQTNFCFLSGNGADQTEQSRMSFARYKGAAEKALLGIGFSRVHIFRPGYIYPVESRREPNFGYRAMRALYPVLRPLLANMSVTSDELAMAMVETGLQGADSPRETVLENRDIRDFAALVKKNPS